MDRRNTNNAREEANNEIKRDRGYLRILNMLEGRNKTRFKEYYRGRIQVAEKLLQLLDGSENENK